MSADLAKGTRLKSLNGIDIVIDKKLGEGGQGYVYKVDYNGMPKALKIYKPDRINDKKAFYENLKNNIAKGSPCETFLWPEDMLKWNGRTFGYIMDLRPPEYIELVDYMNKKKPNVRFESFKVSATAILKLIHAFRLLHARGYSYQDLNDGNFFIHPQTGDVLICDNDNVSQFGRNTGILGTPQYMAPEIVRGEEKPNTETDRFSLAVVIFIILTMSHPLEGIRHLCSILSANNERIIYGIEPIFTMDPTDRRNAPDPQQHKNILRLWPELPDYLQQMFIRQFSKEVMHKPVLRATEQEWLEIFMRFRSDILICNHCDDNNFRHDENAPLCQSCGKPLPVMNHMKITGLNYTLPVTPGNIIYRAQLGSSDIEKETDPVFVVMIHPKDRTQLVLHNRTDREFRAIKPDGSQVMIRPNGAITNLPGTQIQAYDKTITIF